MCAQVFSHSDTAYVLAFSIVMLNTDLHNRAVKRKMTLDDFVRNNRGIDQGKDLPRELLKLVYERILRHEIHTGEDHAQEVERIAANIVGKYADLVQPYRHFVAMLNATEILDLGRSVPRGKHLRTLFLFNDILLISKPVTTRRELPSQSGERAATAAGESRVVLVPQFRYRDSFSLAGMAARRMDDTRRA